MERERRRGEIGSFWVSFPFSHFPLPLPPKNKNWKLENSRKASAELDKVRQHLSDIGKLLQDKAT